MTGKEETGEKRTRLRFIAGAVCPQCGEMDRLVIESVHAAVRGEDADSGFEAGSAIDTEYRRCVNCGFTDERPAIGIMAPRNRLEGGLKSMAHDSETPSTRVRILDPRGDPRGDPRSD